jgi:hypothetical protein
MGGNIKFDLKQVWNIVESIHLNMAIFWDVMQCSLVKLADVSEVLTASNIRAMENLKSYLDPSGLVYGVRAGSCEHHRVYNSPTLHSSLRQMNPIHTQNHITLISILISSHQRLGT